VYSSGQQGISTFVVMMQQGINNNTMLLLFSSIQLFIIYVPNQQLQGQLQTQHNADIYITKPTPCPLARKRTIPTERPPLVDDI
jgi:hypothetical protein